MKTILDRNTIFRSSEIQITVIQKYKLEKYKFHNIQKYKLRKYTKANYRNIKIKITEVQKYK